MSESTPPNSSASTPDAEQSPEDQSQPSRTQPEVSQKLDDLPEEYELTPELVEEEAIRGDFVLRWAAVLLAVLLGCTHIADSEALVHVKTGQYLASHGVIPDGTDPFAYTTEGRVWRNHSWLFDLMLAGVFSLGGAVGLSLFKGLLSGATIWCVVTITRPRIPTWWNAIVAVLGVVALIPYLTATPEIVTILGCAVLLRLFSSWRFQTSPSLNWKLVVLFLVWGNTDPRMYLGLLLLVLLAIGELLRSNPREDAPMIPANTLWSTVGLVFLASLMNPFGWHSWIAAWEVHGVFDPAMRTYFAESGLLENLHSFPVWSAPFWDQLTAPFICALVVAGLAISSIYLNFGKWIAGDILAVLVFGGLAACTLREFGPAIVVMCVVTSLYCQDWYRDSFSQEYTVNQGELLFSRGGRALTVISFVAVAWLGMSGRLYRGYLSDMGFGFENNLNVSLAGLQSDLTDSYDDRPFNFTIGQGDTLIWGDQRVFIDSRLGLFTGSSESLDDPTQTDLILLHSRTRQAMRLTNDIDTNRENRALWKSTFDQFEITHALPRIAGRNPDYITYNMLIVNPEFQITILSPSVAVFYRNDLAADKYRQYLADHTLNFIDQAFGEDLEEEESMVRSDFPQPQSAYVSYLTSDREQIPPSLVLAQHYSQHIEQATQGGYQIDFRTQLAFCYLAIRNTNLALAENPDNSRAFRLLGRVYFFLGLIERQFAENNGFEYDPELRLTQSQLALHQALIGNPEDLEVTERLLRIAQSRRRPETILRMARRLVELLQDPELKYEQKQDLLENTQQIIDEISPQLDPIYEQVKTQLEEDADPLQIAIQLNSLGCPFTALEILEENSQDIPTSPQSDLLKGILLLETGQAEDAYNSLLKLEPMFSQFGIAEGFRFAAHAALGHADYNSAVEFKAEETNVRETLAAAQVLMPTMPFTVDPEIYTLGRFQNWTRWATQVQEETARNIWEQAVFRIEQGNYSEAAELLQRAMEISPNASFRPMLFSYLSCVSEEELDPFPPTDRIPVTGDMFADDPQEAQE